MLYPNSVRNELLAALKREELLRLGPYLHCTSLFLGQVVCEAGERLDSIYFPTTSVLSLVYTTIDGATAEVGVIGSDGMLGLASILRGNSMPIRAIAQIAGEAIRVPVPVVQREFASNGTLAAAVLRYTQALFMQVAQNAVCNRLHSMQQRLCRWLLLCQDRTHSDELLLTQEFISQMLGGRRESVTVSAGHLQDAGLIHYKRGHIKILDRLGLENYACECYRVVRDDGDRPRGPGRKIGPQIVSRSNAEVSPATG